MGFEIHKTDNSVEVTGLIKSIAQAEAVIEALKSLTSNNIRLRIKDSFGLPSSIIGYLVKLKDEGKNITLEVGSPILYELLEDLNLQEIFKIRKI